MPRKKNVSMGTEADSDVAEIGEAKLEENQYAQDSELYVPSEKVSETDWEDMLRETEPIPDVFVKATDSVIRMEEKFDLSAFGSGFSENGSPEKMTDEMYRLFDGAKYSEIVLTGRLTGVEKTSLGIIANVSFNKNDGTLNGANCVSVKIKAENMGLNMDAIRSGIAKRNETNGLRPSNEMFEQQVRNYQFRFIRQMLGAKIDFVTNEIIEDENIVIGNREKAMQIQRNSFLASKSRGQARYWRGSVVLSRVLRVLDNLLVVEVYGFEVSMTLRQVTPLAVKIRDAFKPGDTFPVLITDVTEKGIKLIGARGAKINISRRVHEYHIGAIVLAEVISISKGIYNLQMPNGCRGVIFFNKAMLRRRIMVGGKITVAVVGFNKSDDSVKCALK